MTWKFLSPLATDFNTKQWFCQGMAGEREQVESPR